MEGRQVDREKRVRAERREGERSTEIEFVWDGRTPPNAMSLATGKESRIAHMNPSTPK